MIDSLNELTCIEIVIIFRIEFQYWLTLMAGRAVQLRHGDAQLQWKRSSGPYLAGKRRDVGAYEREGRGEGGREGGREGERESVCVCDMCCAVLADCGFGAPGGDGSDGAGVIAAPLATDVAAWRSDQIPCHV